MQRAVTKKQIGSEDKLTQYAIGFSDIPEGAEVEVIQRRFVNYYGVWVIVRYNGRIYYTSEDNLKFEEEN